jgi:hypothetical protein
VLPLVDWAWGSLCQPFSEYKDRDLDRQPGPKAIAGFLKFFILADHIAGLPFDSLDESDEEKGAGDIASGAAGAGAGATQPRDTDQLPAPPPSVPVFPFLAMQAAGQTVPPAPDSPAHAAYASYVQWQPDTAFGWAGARSLQRDLRTQIAALTAAAAAAGTAAGAPGSGGDLSGEAAACGGHVSRALRQLWQYVADDSERVRVKAASALGPAAVSAMAVAGASPALFRIVRDSLLCACLRLAADPDSAVRAAVAGSALPVLALCAPPAVLVCALVPCLLRLLLDPAARVHLAAAGQLCVFVSLLSPLAHQEQTAPATGLWARAQTAAAAASAATTACPASQCLSLALALAAAFAQGRVSLSENQAVDSVLGQIGPPTFSASVASVAASLRVWCDTLLAPAPKPLPSPAPVASMGVAAFPVADTAKSVGSPGERTQPLGGSFFPSLVPSEPRRYLSALSASLPSIAPLLFQSQRAAAGAGGAAVAAPADASDDEEDSGNEDDGDDGECVVEEGEEEQGDEQTAGTGSLKRRRQLAISVTIPGAVISLLQPCILCLRAPTLAAADASRLLDVANTRLLLAATMLLLVSVPQRMGTKAQDVTLVHGGSLVVACRALVQTAELLKRLSVSQSQVAASSKAVECQSIVSTVIYACIGAQMDILRLRMKRNPVSMYVGECTSLSPEDEPWRDELVPSVIELLPFLSTGMQADLFPRLLEICGILWDPALVTETAITDGDLTLARLGVIESIDMHGRSALANLVHLLALRLSVQPRSLLKVFLNVYILLLGDSAAVVRKTAINRLPYVLGALVLRGASDFALKLARHTAQRLRVTSAAAADGSWFLGMLMPLFADADTNENAVCSPAQNQAGRPEFVSACAEFAATVRSETITLPSTDPSSVSSIRTSVQFDWSQPSANQSQTLMPSIESLSAFINVVGLACPELAVDPLDLEQDSTVYWRGRKRSQGILMKASRLVLDWALATRIEAGSVHRSIEHLLQMSEACIAGMAGEADMVALWHESASASRRLYGEDGDFPILLEKDAFSLQECLDATIVFRALFFRPALDRMAASTSSTAPIPATKAAKARLVLAFLAALPSHPSGVATDMHAPNSELEATVSALVSGGSDSERSTGMRSAPKQADNKRTGRARMSIDLRGRRSTTPAPSAARRAVILAAAFAGKLVDGAKERQYEKSENVANAQQDPVSSATSVDIRDKEPIHTDHESGDTHFANTPVSPAPVRSPPSAVTSPHSSHSPSVSIRPLSMGKGLGTSGLGIQEPVVGLGRTRIWDRISENAARVGGRISSEASTAITSLRSRPSPFTTSGVRGTTPETIDGDANEASAAGASATPDAEPAVPHTPPPPKTTGHDMRSPADLLYSPSASSPLLSRTAGSPGDAVTHGKVASSTSLIRMISARINAASTQQQEQQQQQRAVRALPVLSSRRGLDLDLSRPQGGSTLRLGAGAGIDNSQASGGRLDHARVISGSDADVPSSVTQVSAAGLPWILRQRTASAASRTTGDDKDRERTDSMGPARSSDIDKVFTDLDIDNVDPLFYEADGVANSSDGKPRPAAEGRQILSRVKQFAAKFSNLQAVPLSSRAASETLVDPLASQSNVSAQASDASQGNSNSSKRLMPPMPSVANTSLAASASQAGLSAGTAETAATNAPVTVPARERSNSWSKSISNFSVAAMGQASSGLRKGRAAIAHTKSITDQVMARARDMMQKRSEAAAGEAAGSITPGESAKRTVIADTPASEGA